MNKHRWWHRVRGHKIVPKTFDPEVIDADLVKRGKTVREREVALLLNAMTVVKQCSCGDQWVFYALGFNETYYPASQVREAF